MKAAILAALALTLAGTTIDSAKANSELETALFVAVNSYASMKAIANACDLPPHDFISMRVDITRALLKNIRLDHATIDRNIEQQARDEAERMGATCFPAMQKLYDLHQRGMSNTLNHLNYAVTRSIR